MTHFICVTCGTQHAESEMPPADCPICEDERQYVGDGGQRWTTMDALASDHHNVIREQEPGLVGIGTQPSFAIGPRALLVQTPHGNLLWDCLSLLDQPTIEAVRALGGVRTIAISHPHMYSAMVEWSRAFDAPIVLHGDDREHVMRPDEAIQFWEGETRELWQGMTLVRCGGHFAGSQVAHWAAGAGGKGALLTGDTMMVVPDRRYVSFMRSYPNLIPLPAGAVRRIVAAVEPFAYDRVYSAWWDRVLAQGAKAAVERSASRYIAAIEG